MSDLNNVIDRLREERAARRSALGRRAQLRAELATYATPDQRGELFDILDRYPDEQTEEIRELLRAS